MTIRFPRIKQLGHTLPLNLVVWVLLLFYLSPVCFMIVTAMKSLAAGHGPAGSLLVKVNVTVPAV